MGTTEKRRSWSRRYLGEGHTPPREQTVRGHTPVCLAGVEEVRRREVNDAVVRGLQNCTAGHREHSGSCSEWHGESSHNSKDQWQRRDRFDSQNKSITRAAVLRADCLACLLVYCSSPPQKYEIVEGSTWPELVTVISSVSRTKLGTYRYSLNVCEMTDQTSKQVLQPHLPPG